MIKTKIKLLLSKKNNVPQLSICIPTLNRPKKFYELLSKISSELSDEIEIVIRDDSQNNQSFKNFERIYKNFTFQCQYFKGNPDGLDKANLFGGLEMMIY